MESKTDFEAEFTTIYDKERWGKGKGSGTGSAPKYCKKLIDYLNGILPEYESVLDLGCGDWQYAQEVNWPKDYLGVDVVKSVLDKTKLVHGNPNRAFHHMDFQHPDMLFDLLAGDDREIVIIKDVLQHWSDDEVKEFLDELMTYGWRTLLIINDWRFNRDKSKNDGRPRDINNPYRWAPLDLVRDPLYCHYGFQDVLYYPGGRFKQVARIG